MSPRSATEFVPAGPAAPANTDQTQPLSHFRGGESPPATAGLGPGNSHIRAVPSVLALVIVRPSREKASATHTAACPCRAPFSVQPVVSQSWMLPLPRRPPVPCAVASVLPSGENVRQRTEAA